MSIGRVPGATGIQPSIVDAKGDLIVATAADSVDRLAVGSANQVLTVDSSTATGLKWAATSTASYVGVSCTKSTDQNISTNTFTAVTFNGEEFDTDSFHSTSTNTSRITIPSGKAGKYLINATLVWDGNATSVRRGDLYKNGALARVGTITNNTGTANQCVFSILTVLDLAVNDYVELFAYQESGSTVAVRGYTGGTSFQATYLGA